jgi:hypothetical protein
VSVTVADALAAAEGQVEMVFAGRPKTEATARHALGVTWRNLGKYAAAERLLRRAVELRERELGPDDPLTLDSQNNLAVTLEQSGRPGAALELQQQVLEAYRRVFGPDHPNTLAVIQNLATGYQLVGQPAEALPLFQHALDKQQATLGPDHRSTLTTLNNLARAQLAAGYNGQGGAVWLNAKFASQPLFTFQNDTFSKNTALGGNGGMGVNGSDGAAGGDGTGGALYYNADFAAAPTLSIVSSTFTANGAVGGRGGAGGDAGVVANAENGGKGAAGGAGNRGAVYADFQDSAAGTVTFTSDTVFQNAAQGGNGGAGGAGIVGGDGGHSGVTIGGGLTVSISDFAAGAQLAITRSSIINNLAFASSATPAVAAAWLGAPEVRASGVRAEAWHFTAERLSTAKPPTRPGRSILSLLPTTRPPAAAARAARG